MFRIVKFILKAILIGAIMLLAWVWLTRVSAEELPPLKTGDLVFQTVDTPQTLAIMAASSTLYSHVGMINVAEDGQVTVVEAAGPVREVPLHYWIDQGVGGRITIKRLPDLSDEQAKQIVAAARSHDGKAYDFLFRFDRETIYCSELVYYAYQDGAAIDLGVVEKVGDLNTDNVAVRRIIEARWQNHPICQTPSSNTLESCYAAIMAQELITPVSVADDPRLELVFSNYSLF